MMINRITVQLEDVKDIGNINMFYMEYLILFTDITVSHMALHTYNRLQQACFLVYCLG